jgi:hypothetical protein
MPEPWILGTRMVWIDVVELVWTNPLTGAVRHYDPPVFVN